MKLNPMAGRVAGSNLVDLQGHPNRMAAGTSALPAPWTRGSASASTSAIAGQPKPLATVPRHEPGTHRAVSSLPLKPGLDPHSPALPQPFEAPLSPLSSVGNRLANAFENTKDDVVGRFKNDPARTLMSPIKSIVATISAFLVHLFKPSK